MPNAVIKSLNIGAPMVDHGKPGQHTGINKQPVTEPVEFFAPGPKGNGSGVRGDFIGDNRHHGGDDQAVYAVAREDLDEWEHTLGRELPDGCFGENLTTVGIDVNQAVLGERWRLGKTVEVTVTVPRIPCNTFRAWLNVQGWLRTFTLRGRPGSYLRVSSPGLVASGDSITVLHRPDHGVTIADAFRAMTVEPAALPKLLVAVDDLTDELRINALRAQEKLSTR